MLGKTLGLIILGPQPRESKFYEILKCRKQLNWLENNSPASLYSAGNTVKKSTNFTNNTNIEFFPTLIIPTKCVHLLWRFQKIREYILYL